MCSGGARVCGVGVWWVVGVVVSGEVIVLI